MERELKEIIDGVEVTDLIYPNTLGLYIFQALAKLDAMMKDPLRTVGCV